MQCSCHFCRKKQHSSMRDLSANTLPITLRAEISWWRHVWRELSNLCIKTENAGKKKKKTAIWSKKCESGNETGCGELGEALRVKRALIFYSILHWPGAGVFYSVRPEFFFYCSANSIWFLNRNAFLLLEAASLCYFHKNAISSDYLYDSYYNKTLKFPLGNS